LVSVSGVGVEGRGEEGERLVCFCDCF
jgi:hypothetical protein